MDPSSGTVQHVTKASSDELLRKFAELDDSDTPRNARAGKLLLRGPIRRKRTSRRVVSGLAARDVAIAPANVDSSSAATRRRRSGSLAEMKSFLPTTTRRGGGAPSLFRKMVVGKSSELRPRGAAGIGLILAALEKTWRKTMEGASKMFVEKQCNGHVRLISDVV